MPKSSTKVTDRIYSSVRGNCITIYKMENQNCVGDFIRSINSALRYIRSNSLKL